MGNSDAVKIISLFGSVILLLVRISLLPEEVASALEPHKTVVQMIFNLPSEYLTAIMITLAVVALLFCCGTYLYRLGEHNDKYDLDRVSNKPKARYVGCLILAIASTMISAFVLGILIVHVLGGTPDVYDYCIVGGILAAPLGIAWTIIFCEGISGFGKWLEQKGKETKEVIDTVKDNGIVVDQEALVKLFAALGVDVSPKKETAETVEPEFKEGQA